MKPVFISWTPANGRTSGLSNALGCETLFAHHPGPGGLLARYARQWRTTRAALCRTSRPGVMLMLPPAPALLAVLGALPKHTNLVCDLHTGFFLDPKWRWASHLALRLMRRRRALAVVTNTALQARCERAGVSAVILHDRVHPDEFPQRHAEPEHRTRPVILVPFSYANDEPVDAVLAAAADTPEIEWLLTGEPPSGVRLRAPGNVVFTGYVAPADYRTLVTSATAIGAFTTRPHTMQRAGYEALSAGVPLLTSDFPELRAFHAGSARYTAARPRDIAAAARALIADLELVTQAGLLVRTARIAEQSAALARVRSHLNSGGEPS